MGDFPFKCDLDPLPELSFFPIFKKKNKKKKQSKQGAHTLILWVLPDRGYKFSCSPGLRYPAPLSPSHAKPSLVNYPKLIPIPLPPSWTQPSYSLPHPLIQARNLDRPFLFLSKHIKINIPQIRSMKVLF